jgi:hypothetical protein
MKLKNGFRIIQTIMGLSICTSVFTIMANISKYNSNYNPPIDPELYKQTVYHKQSITKLDEGPS